MQVFYGVNENQARRDISQNMSYFQSAFNHV